VQFQAASNFLDFVAAVLSSVSSNPLIPTSEDLAGLSGRDVLVSYARVAGHHKSDGPTRVFRTEPSELALMD